MLRSQNRLRHRTVGGLDPRSGRLLPSQQSSYYEETDEEAQGHATQATAGEFLPAAAKAKAETQLQEPSQPSVLPATEKTAQAQKKAKPEEPRTPATKASTKEEQASTAHKGEEAKDTELHGGTGEALPAATATKEESDRPRDDQPTGSQATGTGELLPGPSVDAAKTTTAPARAEAAKAEGVNPTTNTQASRRRRYRHSRALRCQRAPGYGTRARCLRR